MRFSARSTFYMALIATLCTSNAALAAAGHPAHTNHSKLKEPPRPTQRLTLPPTEDQAKFNLPATKKPRTDLVPQTRVRQAAATADCKDMNKMATYSGAALAQYVATLPDYECTYPLFSAAPALAQTIYSSSNMNAVVSRFSQEAGAYNASNMALVNLALYLRAGYYQAGSNGIPAIPSSVTTNLRTPIKTLVEGNALYVENAAATPTAGETIKLITNMHDEAWFLPSMKKVVQRFTHSPGSGSAEPLKQSSAGGGMTSALTVFWMVHYRPEGITLVQNDLSYATTLNNFVNYNKAALLNTSAAYQLKDTANEAFRFMQYAGLKSGVRPMIQNTLNTSSMTGADSDLWIAAAQAVKYYDNANCSFYGTCNYESQLANAVLKTSHTCSPSLKIRAQDMTLAQLQDSCGKLANTENYFHTMLQTNRTPVANDNNTALELVVFDDYANYAKYASAIYDIDTNNGGMYLEGNPATAGNQARFIAHEASWLRPTFQVWNLEHEYIHYLDGRFNMHGDFEAGTVKPTVWWIEGVAEYLSLKNNNQQSIDIAKSGTYKLSQIFGNSYSMSDYTTRAYKWGYMAVRFMNERHRADINTVLSKFRPGDYNGYQAQMDFIGTRYDNEFASWVSSATTAGEPPLPVPNLPACSSNSQLGKNCAISGLSSSSQSWIYIMLPAGAKNLKLMTYNGTGDVDMYVALDRYPSTTSYDFTSANVGNNETVSISAPSTGRWYYIMLKAKTPFSGVSVGASYD
jgi:microbial collagenase